MASEKEYLDFILKQLSGPEGVSYRPMMGEYILYYQEKVIGGIYDDRLPVKPVKAVRHLMPGAPYEVPYEGGGKMLLVEEADDWEFLQNLFRAMYDQLPPPKKRK